jgi:hypothetical protein
VQTVDGGRADSQELGQLLARHQQWLVGRGLGRGPASGGVIAQGFGAIAGAGSGAARWMGRVSVVIDHLRLSAATRVDRCQFVPHHRHGSAVIQS